MSHDFTLAPKAPKSCPPATAPNILQFHASHATGEAAGTNLVTGLPLTTGDAAFYGGKIAVGGCDPVVFTIAYITGGDCDGCSPDTLTTETRTLTVDPSVISSISIPDGWFQDITYEVSAGAGVVGVPNTTVDIYSACQPDPCCGVPAV